MLLDDVAMRSLLEQGVHHRRRRGADDDSAGPGDIAAGEGEAGSGELAGKSSAQTQGSGQKAATKDERTCGVMEAMAEFVQQCPGCGEMFLGLTQCIDCIALERVSESRRVSRAHMLAETKRERGAQPLWVSVPREDVGVAAYAPPQPPLAVPLVVLGGMLCSPLAAYAAWHYGKMLIAYLCGAQ